MKEKDAMKRRASVRNRAGRVVCSSLALAQTLLPNTPSSCMVAVAQNRNRMFKIEKVPFSGLGIFFLKALHGLCYPWRLC